MDNNDKSGIAAEIAKSSNSDQLSVTENANVSALLLWCVCHIATIMCIHQVIEVEDMYGKLFDYRSFPDDLDKRQLFESALQICRKETIITGIHNGWAYQTLSILKMNTLNDKQIMDIVLKINS